VQPAGAVSPPAATAPVPRQTSLGLTPDEYKAQMAAPAQGTTTAGGPTPDGSSLTINIDYQADSNSSAKGRGGDGQMHGIILHSSDGRESGDLNQLTHGGVSAHYYVTTDGRIYNLVRTAIPLITLARRAANTPIIITRIRSGSSKSTTTLVARAARTAKHGLRRKLLPQRAW
jgi:hypothetical protein